MILECVLDQADDPSGTAAEVIVEHQALHAPSLSRTTDEVDEGPADRFRLHLDAQPEVEKSMLG
jgi:hypothetical protein